jgi:hypothetical protein
LSDTLGYPLPWPYSLRRAVWTCARLGPVS